MAKRQYMTSDIDLSHFRVEMSRRGFTLWFEQGDKKYWVLDGSCLSDDGEIQLGMKNEVQAVYDSRRKSIRFTVNNPIGIKKLSREK